MRSSITGNGEWYFPPPPFDRVPALPRGAWRLPSGCVSYALRDAERGANGKVSVTLAQHSKGVILWPIPWPAAWDELGDRGEGAWSTSDWLSAWKTSRKTNFDELGIYSFRSKCAQLIANAKPHAMGPTRRGPARCLEIPCALSGDPSTVRWMCLGISALGVATTRHPLLTNVLSLIPQASSSLPEGQSLQSDTILRWDRLPSSPLCRWTTYSTPSSTPYQRLSCTRWRSRSRRNRYSHCCPGT